MPPTARLGKKKGAGTVAVEGIGTVKPRLERFGIALFQLIHDPAPNRAFFKKFWALRVVQSLENLTQRSGGTGSDDLPCAEFLR